MNWANKQYEFEKWAVPTNKVQVFVCWGKVDGEEREKTRKIRASQTFLTALFPAFPSTHLSPPLALAPPPLCCAITQPSKITKEKKN